MSATFASTARGQTHDEERLLVLMPGAQDGERCARLLREELGVASLICEDMAQLCRELRTGAGAIVLTDDVLTRERCAQLEDGLRDQPGWSALPILLLAREGVNPPAQFAGFDGLQSAVVLERPVRTRALFSAVRSALRARRGQYQIREALQQSQRQAAELAAQDEKLRFALSAGGLGSWEVELDTGTLHCSDICKANFGRAPDAPFSYDEFQASVHDDDQARVRAAIARSLASGDLYDIEYRVVWPNGETHWVMIRGRAICGPHGRPMRMVGVSLDVTERERLHDALRQSQTELARQADQLRAADRLKDEFLATLAHELRNPLAPITAGLALLAESPDRNIVHKTLGVMQRQVTHMVRLIDDLLDVSRITRGKLELKRERVALSGVLEAALEASHAAIQRGEHSLRLELSDEPLFIDADPTRIAQVVSNLLNNASKYTPPGGTITLTSTCEQGQAVISVRDTGYGIPPEHLDEVFEMFSQVNRALERSQGGLGIGLALVRRLVEMHGGSVTVSSAGADRGSTFTVKLPLAAVSSAALEARAGHVMPALAGTRVLVVDDNEDAAQMLALMLERYGYATATAHDGAGALDAARTMAPHVAILDIGLPGMNGYELARHMRQDPTLARTVLIALTGWGTAQDKRKALGAGFDLHMTKPVDVGHLRAALDRTLRDGNVEQAGR